MLTDQQKEQLEEVLKKVEAYETLGGDVPTRKEVADAIKAVLEFVKNLRLKDFLSSELNRSKAEMTTSVSSSMTSELMRLGSSLEEMLSKNSKAEIDSLAKNIYIEIKKLENIIPKEIDLTEVYNTLKELDDKIVHIKDIKAEDLRDKLEGLEGEDRLDKSAIKGLDEMITMITKEVKKSSGVVYVGGAGSGGGRMVKSYDISASLNGVLKTFTLPAFWRIISVHSSSFPNAFRETVDWTSDGSAMTITFTSEIDAGTTLATGQTITVVYSE